MAIISSIKSKYRFTRHCTCVERHKCHYNYYRLVHSFTCSGMTPTKYMNFSKFARLGVIGPHYIKKGKIRLTVC